jgi:hypothetical protein
LASLAGLARARGDAERAAYLMGASRSITETLGLAFPAATLEENERTIEDLRSRLGDATFDAAWERGLSADWEAALECGLL